jgi:[acyl-carrier-protein] S-malonyltransferase
MAKTVFLFPGQGSQEIGMGRDLFKSDANFRSLVEFASAMTGCDLEDICMKGPERDLIKSRIVQPLLVAVSLGYLRHVREAGIDADVVAGHSLGEISALAAAGVVSDREAVAMATKRGILMDEAASKCDGSMMAVLFAPLEKVEQILSDMGAPERIVLANDNAPDQIVISGDNTLLDQFAHHITHEKYGKSKKLVVSGPWHSPYLRNARLQFEDWAEPVLFHKPRIPLVMNATAKTETHPTTIKHLVTWQLTAPVFWRESMETLRDMQVDTILEIGPGRILSGLARVNGLKKGVAVYNINNMRGVEKAVEELVTRTRAIDINLPAAESTDPVA